MLRTIPKKPSGRRDTPPDYLDPFIQQRLSADGNWALYTLNRYGPNTLNYFAKSPNPSAPTADNWLGTDDQGAGSAGAIALWFSGERAVRARAHGHGRGAGRGHRAIQGFLGQDGPAFQRFIEIWGSMPELYLLIIFSAVFAPSIALLLILLSLFGWMGLSDYVRAEFLRNRQLDYVKAARALGVGNWHIIWRHILPNSLTPWSPSLPFRMVRPFALTSLDFLGLGAARQPSLGELLSQGKNSIDAWWISLSTFAVLVVTCCCPTFMGDACAMLWIHEGRQVMHAHAQPPPPLCLRVRDLRVRWRQVGGAWRGLQDCPGRKLALVGESGSGKTITALSLLRLLGDAAVEGQACCQGATCCTLSEREMRGVRGGDIAMVFQEPMTALNPLMTIGQQIAEILMLKTTGAECAQAAIELLAKPASLSLPARGQLSAPAFGRAAPARHDRHGPGQQTPTAAGRQPTTALDVTLRGQILDLLSDLQRQTGMAVLLITHDLNLVRRFCRPRGGDGAGRAGRAGRCGRVFANPSTLHAPPDRQPAPARCGGGGPARRHRP